MLESMSVPADEPYVEIGCRHDAPEIAALARDALPSFPALHDEDGWRSFYRFGNGAHPRDNYLLVLRDGGEAGSLAAFVWVDAALAIDHEIQEPWWCINAVAVAPAYRRRGLGRALIDTVAARGREVGVTLLYGLSVASAVPFWQSLGLTVAAEDEALVANRPAHRVTGEEVRMHLDPEQDHRWFVGYLAPPAETLPVLIPQGLLSGR